MKTAETLDSAYYPAFLQALLGERSDHPAVAALQVQAAFAVYRNTVLKGCIDALMANYPTVHRLVGSTWMQSVALQFARQHLPTQASLIAYGEGFAGFLARLPSIQELPYLPGVAQLDRDWTEAHLAADQPTLEPAMLHAALAAGQDVRLLVHAAARWHWDAHHPVHTIWDANRGETANESAPCAPLWRGEGTLLTRPHGQVQWQALSHGGWRFMQACRARSSISQAAAQALLTEPGLDIAGMLGELLRAGAFSDFD